MDFSAARTRVVTAFECFVRVRNMTLGKWRTLTPEEQAPYVAQAKRLNSAAPVLHVNTDAHTHYTAAKTRKSVALQKTPFASYTAARFREVAHQRDEDPHPNAVIKRLSQDWHQEPTVVKSDHSRQFTRHYYRHLPKAPYCEERRLTPFSAYTADHFAAVRAAADPQLSTQHVVRLLAQRWGKEPPEVKEQYSHQFQEHFQKHRQRKATDILPRVAIPVPHASLRAQRRPHRTQPQPPRASPECPTATALDSTAL